MSDLIDREALLRQIDIDSEGEPGYYGDTWKFIDTIKNMPPALGTNLAEVGTDLISRQQAIDLWDKYHYTIAVDAMRYDAELRQLPSAQPEIIYCGDCKYKDDGIDEDGIPFLKCLHGRSYGGTRINDFCSWAERRGVTE